MPHNKEIECRFLEIDVPALKQELAALGAQDHGENLLKEIVFYDKEGTFVRDHRFVRLRNVKGNTILTYKERPEINLETVEIETKVDDMQKAKELLVAIGLIAFREQEKKCHEFTLGKVTIGIDTWPTIPPYVELEGENQKDLQEMAEKLGFDWKDADTTSARVVIEERYGLHLTDLHYFTFSRIE
jgi:adenylate cyclase, class 2